MSTESVFTWRTRQEIEICEDCLFMSANGSPNYEGYAETNHAERYSKAVEIFGDEPCSISEESSFSRNPCEFCGDTLGGSRVTASVMQLHKEELSEGIQ
jgi:hypothetical protein